MWVWTSTPSAPASAMASMNTWAVPRLPSWAWATSPTITHRGASSAIPALAFPEGHARGLRRLVAETAHQLGAGPLDLVEVALAEQAPPPLGPAPIRLPFHERQQRLRRLSQEPEDPAELGGRVGQQRLVADLQVVPRRHGGPLAHGPADQRVPEPGPLLHGGPSQPGLAGLLHAGDHGPRIPNDVQELGVREAGQHPVHHVDV